MLFEFLAESVSICPGRWLSAHPHLDLLPVLLCPQREGELVALAEVTRHETLAGLKVLGAGWAGLARSAGYRHAAS